MERDEKGQTVAGTESKADGQEQGKSRGQTREDHLAAGRQLASDESQARANAASDASRKSDEIQDRLKPAVDNDDISELSENDSSGG
ncbi:MAG TPA: hypothetical protein VFR15_03710 [Chloroflexia bacterium]|nr:hypothetical protein [Chloroflexia bacterium]